MPGKKRSQAPAADALPATVVLQALDRPAFLVEDGVIGFANAAAERLFGRRAGRLVGLELRRLLEPNKALRVDMPPKGPTRTWCRFRRFDGSAFEAVLLIAPLDGRDKATLATMENVPEQLDGGLARDHPMDAETLRFVEDERTDLISVHDPQGAFAYVSPVCGDLLGYDAEELLGRSVYQFIHPDDLETVSEGHDAVMESPVVYVVEYRIRRRDGHYTWFESYCRGVRNARREIEEIVMVSRDISWRMV